MGKTGNKLKRVDIKKAVNPAVEDDSAKNAALGASPVKTSVSGTDSSAAPGPWIDTAGKTMADFEYFTNRKLANKKTGEETGKARVAVEKGAATAKIEYTCPACANEGRLEQPFEKIPFYFYCGACNFKVKIDKLRKGMKK